MQCKECVLWWKHEGKSAPVGSRAVVDLGVVPVAPACVAVVVVGDVVLWNAVQGVHAVVKA